MAYYVLGAMLYYISIVDSMLSLEDDEAVLNQHK